MIEAIASFLVGLAASLGVLFAPAPVQDPFLGVALPQGVAVFETSLQNRITSTDTSMTLVSTTTRGGGSLSGYQCFTVDEGRSDAEFVCGTLTAGKTVTSLERGLDPLTGTTTNSTLKFAHRVGANVKISDFPLIQRMRSQLSGSDTISSLIRYESGVTPASGGDLTDYEFVTGLAFSGAGVIDATSAAKGVSELATQVETASSTASGSAGPLVIPASTATSTYNSATAALRIPVTQNNGKLDSNFISTSTLFAYTLPALGTASTSLTSNGTGLVFDAGIISPFALDGAVYTTSNTATTTAKSITIPANTLVGNRRIELSAIFTGDNANSNKEFDVQVGDGTSSTTVMSFSVNLLSSALGGQIRVVLQANDSSTVQTAYSHVSGAESLAFLNRSQINVLSLTGTSQNYISLRYRVKNGGDTATYRGISAQVFNY